MDLGCCINKKSRLPRTSAGGVSQAPLGRACAPWRKDLDVGMFPLKLTVLNRHHGTPDSNPH